MKLSQCIPVHEEADEDPMYAQLHDCRESDYNSDEGGMVKDKIHQLLVGRKEKPNAIVLGPDTAYQLMEEFHSATGHLDWFVSYIHGKDPVIHGIRILRSEVEGEISLL